MMTVTADVTDVDESDIAEAARPVQRSTTVANHTKSQAVTDTHGKSRAVSHGHSSAEVINESRVESQIVTDKSVKKRRGEPPPPIVTTVVKPKPVSISERMKSGAATL